jgi:hypothetical protein
MKPPRPALTCRGPTSIIAANTYGEDETLAAKDARPPSRNLDAARLLGHYRTMLRIRAFEEAALEGLEEKLVLGAIPRAPISCAPDLEDEVRIKPEQIGTVVRKMVGA